MTFNTSSAAQHAICTPLKDGNGGAGCHSSDESEGG